MPYSSLILASSSPFRKELLSRLHLPFDTLSPDIDETHLDDESAEQYVSRLSLQKAQAIASNNQNAIVIG
ncbi:MAG: Maf family protein, partial [Gammaproteobacteria bacterium]|nr:Maf family protein [Gammaproteobacteria bacterium]